MLVSLGSDVKDKVGEERWGKITEIKECYEGKESLALDRKSVV